MTALPAAPDHLLATDGTPRFGRYRGHLPAPDWASLAAPWQRTALWRRFHHKRWQYVALSTQELFCGIAIVDIGWTNTCFAYVFHRPSGTLLADLSQDGLPGLTANLANSLQAGQQSHFRAPGATIRFQSLGHDRYQLDVDWKHLHIKATLSQPAGPSLTAFGPIAEGGSVHSTEKTTALQVSGSLHVAGQSFTLDQGCASLDYSNGLLARETQWRWASAHGQAIGFNLQAGYFGTQENVLWIDGNMVPLAAAHFEFNAQSPLQPWRITTEDGLLDLTFQPEGARGANKNLLIAASRYIQPIGTFHGLVKAAADSPPREVKNLVGVTEDHYSRW